MCVQAWRGRESGGEWIHVLCRAESLRWSPEAAITLLPGFTPIQNKKLKLGEKKKSTPSNTNVFLEKEKFESS